MLFLANIFFVYFVQETREIKNIFFYRKGVERAKEESQNALDSSKIFFFEWSSGRGANPSPEYIISSKIG
jgi:hypothetical protein